MGTELTIKDTRALESLRLEVTQSKSAWGSRVRSIRSVSFTCPVLPVYFSSILDRASPTFLSKLLAVAERRLWRSSPVGCPEQQKKDQLVSRDLDQRNFRGSLSLQANRDS